MNISDFKLLASYSVAVLYLFPTASIVVVQLASYVVTHSYAVSEAVFAVHVELDLSLGGH